MLRDFHLQVGLPNPKLRLELITEPFSDEFTQPGGTLPAPVLLPSFLSISSIQSGDLTDLNF